MPGEGALRLRLASGDRLEVARAGDDRLLVYDLEGRLQEERVEPGAHARLGAGREAPDTRATTQDGAVFELTSEGLVRTHPPPRELLIPSPPWPLSALGPQPWLVLALALLTSALAIVGGAVLSATRRAPAALPSPRPGD